MASLIEMPVELLTLICQHLIVPNVLGNTCNEGIWALRLTCRAIYNKTYEDFGVFAFHTLQFSLHPRTLTLAKRICHHPIYARAVKRIILKQNKKEVIPFWSDYRTGQMLPHERLLSQVLHSLQDTFKDLYSETPNLTEVAIIAPFNPTFCRTTKETYDKLISRSAELLELEDVTAQLEGPGQSTMSITENTMLTYCAKMPSERLTAFEIIWPPPSCDRIPKYLRRSYINKDDLAISYVSMMNITKLNVVIKLNDAWSPGSIVSIQKALNNLARLQHLELRSTEDFFGGVCRDAKPHEKTAWLQDVHLPQLKTFKLYLWKTHGVVLNAFLATHKDTIEHLEICRVEIAQARQYDTRTKKWYFTHLGCWYDLFETVLDFSHLQEFLLADVTRLAFSQRVKLLDRKASVQAKGKETISKALKDMQLRAEAVQMRAEFGKHKEQPWAFQQRWNRAPESWNGCVV